ncbi:hypothetical protein EZS27_027522 [termite gut metagenome]|uniref:ATPase AAA-type core domain-containing protein n=1 Tax=termite gut metagenome TaxID=433724 RepID=A0A5J4QNW1_9ZZZZ
MRIYNLTLEKIGPFKEAYLEFIGNEDNVSNPPVIIITGENGMGKSIIIDAIRTLFYGTHKIERDITYAEDFLIKSEISLPDNTKMTIITKEKSQDGSFRTNSHEFNRLFSSPILLSSIKDNFVVDYWTSKLSNDTFTIKNIESPETNNYLNDALTGIHKNIDVTKTITFFDYLKDSQDEKERKIGKKMYDLVKKIIDISIKDGNLSYISRTDLKPIIDFQGRKISLDKLSSGNLYLIQRLTHLLKQMYSVCDIHNIPIDDVQKIPGLLLIDEAENHLHPQWQKVFIKNVIRLFPNLQIIVTTHSPFIVSSVENSRIYVCSSHGDHSVVKEETDFYANTPIEEILISPLFNTNSFNIEISQLLSQRKEAIQTNNETLKKDIEEQLLERNPEYFNYLTIDKIIENINR